MLANIPKDAVDPKISFRILHRCDFQCPACSTFSGPKLRGCMDPADFRRAIDLLAAASFRGQLNISGGEPTLHPHCEDMMGYACHELPHANVVMYTHGHWVGERGWRQRLDALLSEPNAMLRFSVDRQHDEGALRGFRRKWEEAEVLAMKGERLAKAALFADACREKGASPGRQWDFAYKGTLEEARHYTSELGDVPLYLIRFRPKPGERDVEWGFFAVDIDNKGRVSVYPTLGHIPRREALGGIETLPRALEMNRSQLRASRPWPTAI